MEIALEKLSAESEKSADELKNIFTVDEKDGDEGAQMKQDVEGDVVVGIACTEDALEDCQMSRGGNGQKFGKSLHQAVQDGFPN